MNTLGNLARGQAPFEPPKYKSMGEGMNKNTRLDIRCSTEEKIRWMQDAKSKGLSVSEYARLRLNGSTKAIIRKKHSCTTSSPLVPQLAAIGNNLNQLTHWAHTYKSSAEGMVIIKGIEALRVELSQAILQNPSSTADHAD